MKTIHLFSLTLVGLGLALSSCDKSKDDPATPNNTPSVSNTPTFSDADGVCAAIKTLSTIEIPGFPAQEISIGTGVAVFYNSSKEAVAAGDVKLNNTTLTNNSNTYVSQVSATQPQGIDFSSGANWEVTGNTTSGIPAFSANTGSSFPTISSINQTGSVQGSASFTLRTTNGISNADSTIFMIASGNKSIMKTMAGNTQTYTFSSTDMGELPKGTAILQIVAYKFTGNLYSGKKIYFVKEAVASKIVTIE